MPHRVTPPRSLFSNGKRGKSTKNKHHAGPSLSTKGFSARICHKQGVQSKRGRICFFLVFRSCPTIETGKGYSVRDTTTVSLWNTISHNLSNHLKMLGIAPTSTEESEFAFEFNLSTRNQNLPMLIQIKTSPENDSAKMINKTTLRKQVAAIVGNSNLKRFVAELDTDGNIHPVYFVDFRGNEISL